MQSHPLVSIVIPCWNAEAFVRDAIESALAQTYPHVEVFVVDDGSTDGSLDIIRSYGSRIRWESGPNRGACVARNRGLELARGEFIQFLDADDLLFPHKLARMVPIALKEGEMAMVVCDWEVTWVDERSPIRRFELGYNGQDPLLFCLTNKLQTSSPLHRRRNLVAIGGFFADLPCNQEPDLHLRLAASGVRLVYCPEVLYHRRKRDNSVSSDYVRLLDQRAGIYTRVLDLLKAHGELTSARRKAIAEAFARDAREYVRWNHPDRAKAYFGSAQEVDVSGGLDVFGRWYTRGFARTIGPLWTELMLQRVVRHLRAITSLI